MPGKIERVVYIANKVGKGEKKKKSDKEKTEGVI